MGSNNWELMRAERIRMIRTVMKEDRSLTARQLHTRLTERYGMNTRTNLSTNEIAYYMRHQLKDDVEVMRLSRGGGFRYSLKRQ